MVLAVLLANANWVVSQDALIDAVWSGEPPAAAKATLHSYVSILRKELGGEIVREGDGYRVMVADDHLDAARFEHQVAEGRGVLADDPFEAFSLLQGALSMWHGHPYGDLGGEPALALEIYRLEELRLVAVEARIQADLALGNHAGVIGALETLIRENPYREELRALQMLALYRSGRQAEALRAYQRTRRFLGEELGIDPSPELRTLEQQILEQDPALRPDVPGNERLQSARPTTGRGMIVRGFELRDRVGEGGVGEVYRAYQPSVGREVAVKVIRPDLVNQAEFIHGFEARAQTVAHLEHPHIVALLDYWRDPEGAYLVTPFIRGGSLQDRLRHGRWEPTATVELLDQVGRALGYAHRHGVVHGRLTPGSVLFDERGTALLGDFRIARESLDAAGATSTTALAYTPPEERSREVLTPRADVFGLGVLAFHLLTGGAPSGPARATVIEACPGLSPDLARVLVRATGEVPADRHATVDDFLGALRRASGVDVATIPTADLGLEASTPLRNPYKGLRSFNEIDATDFYGRSSLIDTLLDAVEAHPLVAVVGPSGSGKSSVVRAGLVPALRSRGTATKRWLITDMFPGSYPFEELEAALMRVAVAHPPGIIDDLTFDDRGLLRVIKQILPPDDSSLLLIIDQFEELFSAVTSDEMRLLFLHNLVTVARDERSRVKVVLTMRADFFDRPLEHAELGRLVRRGMVAVTPPTREGLAQAIVGPARGVAVELEPGLVTEIIHDVDGQPGALPLLQYALTELFDRREGNLLTMRAYRDVGGVLGALGVRAEELFREVPKRARDVTRQLFLRLVTVDDLAGDTRRRVRLTELKSLSIDQRALDIVLDRFGSFRLLTYDRDPVTRTPTVEIAHEALLRKWDRLAGWIDAERESLLIHRRISAATRDWADSGMDPSFLLRGGRLEQGQQWARTTGIALSNEESDFLSASRDLKAAEARALKRRRRTLVGLLAGGLVLALAGSLVAVTQRNQAQRAETVQLAQRLGAEALVEDNLELALLLARQAIEVDERPETRGSLLAVLLREPKAVGIMHGLSEDSLLRGIAVSPRGDVVAVADQFGGAVLRFDATTLEPVGDPIRVPGPVEALAYSPDAESLAIGGGGFLHLVDTSTGSERASVSLGVSPVSRAATQLIFTGSQLLSVETEGGGSVGPAWVTIRDAATLEPAGPTIRPEGFEGTWLSQQRAVPPVVLTDGGRSVIIASTAENEVSWWDIASGESTRVIELDGPWGGYRALAVSPDGSIVAAGLARGFALIDATTSVVTEVGSPDASFPISLQFSSAGTMVISTDINGAVNVWDVDGTSLVDTLDGHSRAVWGSVFSPDGRRLYTAGYDGTAIAWDLEGSGPLVRRPFTFTDSAGLREWPYTHPGRLSPDGSVAAVGLEGRGVGLWNTTDLTRRASLLETAGEARSLAFGADGRALVVVSAEEDADEVSVTVWDVPSAALRAGPIHVRGWGLAISADGSTFATGARSGGIQLWDLATGTALQRLAEGRFDVEVGEFAANGTLLLVDGGGDVEMWDIDEGVSVGSLDVAPNASPIGVATAISSDGTLLATGGLDPMIRIWSLATGEMVRAIEHDVGTGVRALEFAPDGTTLAVAGGDGFVSLWDVPTGIQIGPRLEAGGREALVDISSDGRSLLMTLGNGQGAVWDIDPESWMRRACALANRRLTAEEWAQFLPGRTYEPAC